MNQHPLGNHRATYKPDTRETGCITAVCLVFGAIFLLGGGIGFFIADGIVLRVGVLLFFLLFVYLLLVRIIDRHQQQRVVRAFVYDSGLILREHKSPQTIIGWCMLVREVRQTIIGWRNVREVRHKVMSGENANSHVYTVSCTDGTLLTLDGETTSLLPQIGKLLEEETARSLFPAAYRTYQTSQALTFGPLTVTSQGLSHGSNLLPWSKIKSIKIEDSCIRIRLLWSEVKSIQIYKDSGYTPMRKRGEQSVWIYLQTAEVPNVELFRMLVERIQPGVLE